MDGFKEEFLYNYLMFGLGSMPKADIDALVMNLLERYGWTDSKPLENMSNQAVSEFLKTPLNKVKKLRYDAALKYGGNVKEQGMARLLAALSKANIEIDNDRIQLIVEDVLARNWLQGELKSIQTVYDGSFNTEIVTVKSEALFSVLKVFFEETELERFQKAYALAKKENDGAKRKEMFRKAAKKFAEGASKAAGAGVVALFKGYVGGT